MAWQDARSEVHAGSSGARAANASRMIHTCLMNSTKEATVKVGLTFSHCDRRRKPIGNPPMHNCRVRTDFKSRKTACKKAQQASRAKKPQHLFQECAYET